MPIKLLDAVFPPGCLSQSTCVEETDQEVRGVHKAGGRGAISSGIVAHAVTCVPCRLKIVFSPNLFFCTTVGQY